MATHDWLATLFTFGREQQPIALLAIGSIVFGQELAARQGHITFGTGETLTVPWFVLVHYSVGHDYLQTQEVSMDQYRLPLPKPSLPHYT